MIEVILNDDPAVWLDGDPLLPTPSVNVSPGSVITRFVIAPGTAISPPKFVTPLVTPAIVDVPVLVICPAGNGPPTVGRTRIFCHVREFMTPLVVKSVTVKVICDVVIDVMATEVPVATLFMFLESGPFPETRVTKTVGAVPPTSNINPVGALRIIVPFCIFPFAPSV